MIRIFKTWRGRLIAFVTFLILFTAIIVVILSCIKGFNGISLKQKVSISLDSATSEVKECASKYLEKFPKGEMLVNNTTVPISKSIGEGLVVFDILDNKNLLQISSSGIGLNYNNLFASNSSYLFSILENNIAVRNSSLHIYNSENKWKSETLDINIIKVYLDRLEKICSKYGENYISDNYKFIFSPSWCIYGIVVNNAKEPRIFYIASYYINISNDLVKYSSYNDAISEEPLNELAKRIIKITNQNKEIINIQFDDIVSAKIIRKRQEPNTIFLDLNNSTDKASILKVIEELNTNCTIGSIGFGDGVQVLWNIPENTLKITMRDETSINISIPRDEVSIDNGDLSTFDIVDNVEVDSIRYIAPFTRELIINNGVPPS